jgi:hypothetical protein
MYPTTNPKITARGILMQPGSDPSWLLPYAYMYSVHMTMFLILVLLYSEIFLMHWPHHSVFLDVLIISIGAFAEFGHNAMRNVIDIRTAAP